jgi:hypothetical protein
MEHPKDKGDRTTLAVMLALRVAGYAVLMPFGENTRYDLVIDDGETFSRIQCKTGRLRDGVVSVQHVQLLRPPHKPRDESPGLPGSGRLLRRSLPRHRLRIPHSDRRGAEQEWGVVTRRTVAKQLKTKRSLGGRLRANASFVGETRYCRTWRASWCCRILRLTRWRALSIVFVSTSRRSAISS